MADRIVSWGGFDSKSTSGMGVTGSFSVSGSMTTNADIFLYSTSSRVSNVRFFGEYGAGGQGSYHNLAVDSSNNFTWTAFRGGSYDATPLTLSGGSNWLIPGTMKIGGITAASINSNGSYTGAYATLTLTGGGYSDAINPSINFITWDGGETTSRFQIHSRTPGGANGKIVAVPNNGNFIIGSSTDLSAKLAVRGSGATSSTTSFLVQDSNGNSAFQVKDDRSAIVYGPLSLSRANQGYIYYTANDYIQFPRQGGPAPGYFSTSTEGDGWAFRIATNNQTYARIMEGSFYLEAYTPNSNGRNSIRTWFSGSNFVYIDGDGVTGRSPAYGNGVNVIIRGGKSGTYENLAHLGAAGYVTVEGGSAFSGSFTTHIAGAGVNIQTGLGLGTGSAADLTFSTSTTSSVASTYHTQTQRMVIKGHTGNVGIGTSNPNFTLDVSGSSEFVGSMLITGSVIISGSASTSEGNYTTVPSTLYVKNSIAVFTDLDNTASISLKGSSTNRGLKGIYFYHNNRAAWIESVPNGGGDLGGLRFGAGGNTVLNFGTLGTGAAFSVPVTATSYGGTDNNTGTHYYNFNNSEFAVRIASTRLGSSGRGDLKFQLKVAGGNAADSDTFFYVPGTNKNISINSATTDLGATLGIRGSGTTSSTTAFLVQNANATASLQVKDDLSITAAGSIILQQPGSSNTITINPTGSNFLRYFQAGAFEGNLMTFSGGIITFPNSVNFTNGLASSNIITTNNIGVDNSSTNRYIRFWKSGAATRVTITHTDTGTLQFRVFDSYDDTTGGIGMYITQQGNAGLTGSLTVGSLSTLSEDQRMSITNLGTYYGDMFGLTLPSSFDPGVMYQTTQGGTNWNGQIASGSNIITSYPAGGNYNSNYASYISVGDYVKDYNTGFRARVLTVSATTMSLDRNIAVSYTGSNFTYWPRAYGHTAGTLVYNTTTNRVNYWTTSSLNVLLDSSGSQAITGSLTISGSNAAVTMPSRPAFRVTGSGTMANLTTTQNGDGTLNQNNWAVDYQQGSALTGSTGVFTAPLAGLYQISLVGRNSGYSSGISQLAVVKYSGASSAVQIMVEWASSSTMNHTGGSSITYMNVGDTLKLKVLAGEINFDGNDNWSVAYIG